MRFRYVWTCALALAVTATAMPVSGQSFWMDAGPDQVSLEVVRPALDDGNLTLMSAAYFASGKLVWRENLAAVIELPYTHARVDETDATGSSSIGNPYLGVELSRPDLGLVVSGGARLPLAKFDVDRIGSQAFGMLGTLDRMEAFYPDLAMISGAARVTRQLSPTVQMIGSFGMNLNIYTDNEEGEDSSDLHALYGLQGWYRTGLARVGSGFFGRGILTESGISFNDRTIHELGFFADYEFGRVRPGLHVRVPTDDDTSEIMAYVFGLSVSYRLGH